MGDRHDHSVGFWGYLLIGGGLVAVGSTYGMAYIPAYISYRDVQKAVTSTAKEAQPTMQDQAILDILNRRLGEMSASRYWVEDGVQRQELGLTMGLQNFKAERQGTSGLTIKVDFSQQVYINGLRKVVDVPFHCEAHADKQ